MSDDIRFDLPQSAIPSHWYNVQADLPRPLPPVLHPGTHQPVGPDDLAPLFPMQLIMQEVSQERWIEIPDEVREIYKLWRPTPLLRARRLEKALDTPAHIYYKYEGVSPSGSHKLNTATAQAWYNKQEGINGLTTETGAGQWGTALAQACSFFDMECVVYMVRISYEQKPYRRAIMQSFGASVTASPSDTTNAGRAILEQDADSTGSLGIAISEAVEVAATSGGKYKYSLGSVLNHVLMHQTVIGQEALGQMELAGEYPDVVVGPTGGGSNFAGIALPFLHQNLTAGKADEIARRRAGGLPELDARQVRLRLWRRHRDDTLGEDVYVGAWLRAAAAARRWFALSRHGLDHLRVVGPRLAVHARHPADGDLRRRHHLRKGGRHHRGAGSRSWHRRGDTGSAGRKRSRRRARHTL